MNKINILMVDDQPGKLLTYEAILSELGENLITARSGNEALERLLQNDIAIVLTDVSMPGIDGFQLADMIHQHPRFQNIAIIFVSGARMTMSDRLKGYEHGAVDYMNVPVIPELLRAKVRVFADLHRKARELAALNAEMRRLSSQTINALDEERRRIARELHDGLGQDLTAAKIVADGIKLAGSDEQAAEVSKLIGNALQQVRSLSHLLHPPVLDELGLESAVHWYLDGLTKRSGIETSLEIQPPDFARLTPELENAVFRIIQEALTNSFRHSEAHKVSVSLVQRDGSVTLTVRDDGKGIPNDVAAFKPGSGGVGIGGMRQRVKEFGGELRLSNTAPGTLVEVVLPCKPAESDEALPVSVP